MFQEMVREAIDSSIKAMPLQSYTYHVFTIEFSIMMRLR